MFKQLQTDRQQNLLSRYVRKKNRGFSNTIVDWARYHMHLIELILG